MSIQKNLGNITAINGRITAPHENEPKEYKNRGYPYFNVGSTRFFQEYAKYASDYFWADAQGLNPDDRWAWERVTLRMADYVKSSSALQRQFDNFKTILLDKMKYAHIPRGTKFVTMGSTWLCVNPENISGSDGIGVIQRCNATWNHLDFYGNVVKEPICVDNPIARASAPDYEHIMPIMKGYFNVRCQYNPDTAQIDDNTRMILGSKAYHVTGTSDFFESYTGDTDSVHMMEFTIRKEEPNETIDDLENRVAGGKTFSWTAFITGDPAMEAGETVPFSVRSVRNGETVTSTEEYPIEYTWESSDPAVATVDDNGNVTAVSDGTVNITVTLVQNPEIKQSYDVSVGTAKKAGYDETVQKSLKAYESITLTAVQSFGEGKIHGLYPSLHLLPGDLVYPSDGNKSGRDVHWYFNGADPKAYSAKVNGSKAVISCWSGSIEPLTVTVESEGMTASATIELLGI